MYILYNFVNVSISRLEVATIYLEQLKPFYRIGVTCIAKYRNLCHIRIHCLCIRIYERFLSIGLEINAYSAKSRY